MRLRFAFTHAIRESRSSWRRIGLYISSITLGVAALVAINSFRAGIIDSVEAESRNLLGADLRLSSGREFPDSVQAVIDSARAQGYDIARVVNMVSMAFAPRTQRVHMSQLRAITGEYPFYGAIETEPADAIARMREGKVAVVDPALLMQLDVGVGDTIMLGATAFEIGGSITSAPNDFGFRSAIGPRVMIDGRYLDETGLLGFGSLAQRQTFLKIEDERALERYLEQNRDVFRRHQIDFDIAKEQSENIADALEALTRFLGLVGLTALLLGGVGVASAVHVFIREKRATIATLRCLGATQAAVFGAYLLQAAGLGLIGAAAGVVLGVAVQAALPHFLRGVLPFEVNFSLDAASIATGLGVGVWVAGLFALLPLLAIRGISPLQALRSEYEPLQRRFDGPRWLAYTLLITSVIAIAIWQADDGRAGGVYALGLGVALLLLWLTAALLIRATRRFFPSRASFVARQGIANLFRPRNQTAAVVLSLGFGVFLIATIYLVQENLLGWLRVENSPTAPNLVAFDIQRDQAASVREILANASSTRPEMTPIVPARITHINGRTIDQILADTAAARRVESWALRREYRHTYRDTLTSSEELIAGRWFGRNASPDEISIEEDVAESLNVGLGDRITWDVQGIPVETRITSMRRVDWARFGTNFFVVFPPQTLQNAPQTFVGLARVEDPTARALLQRELVTAHSNVSVIDVAQVQKTLEDIMGRVSLAVRFMAVFSILAGIVVLIGAIATSRFQRMRESVLLKTLGATRAQIARILITEYFALGALAGLAGALFATIAGWLITTTVFDLNYSVPVVALIFVWAVVAGVAVAIGLANSTDVLRKPPLAVLRENGP